MKSSRMGYSVPLGHSADRSVYDTNKQTNKPQAPPAGVPRGLRSLSRYRRDRVWSSRWDQMAGIQMSDKPYLINYGQSILLDERFGNNIPKHYTLIEINECGHRFLDLWALRMDTESWPVCVVSVFATLLLERPKTLNSLTEPYLTHLASSRHYGPAVKELARFQLVRQYFTDPLVMFMSSCRSIIRGKKLTSRLILHRIFIGPL